MKKFSKLDEVLLYYYESLSVNRKLNFEYQLISSPSLQKSLLELQKMGDTLNSLSFNHSSLDILNKF
jgi:hypothetical protein